MAKKQFYEDKVEWREAMISLEKSIKIKPTAEAYTVEAYIYDYCGIVAFRNQTREYFKRQSTAINKALALNPNYRLAKIA